MSEQLLLDIFSILTSIFEFLLFIWVYSWVSSGTPVKFARTKTVITGAIYFSVMFLCYFYGIIPTVKMLILTTIVCVGMHFVYQIRLTKLLTITVYNVLATIVSETLAMGLFLGMERHNKELVETVGQSLVQIESTLMSKILYLLILLVLKNFIVNTKQGYSKKELFMLVVQTISSEFVIILSIELTISFDVESSVSPYVFSVVALCAFVAYCVSIWITDHYFNSQYLLRENIRLEEYRKQKEQYQSIRQDAEQGVRQIYHDLEKHMKAINKLKQGNIQELDEYISDINTILKPYEKYYDTGCEVLDMILTEKQRVAERAGIHFDAKIEEKCMTGLRAFNLNVIFTNALDNALEANPQVSGNNTEAAQTDNRFISVRVRKEREGISILVRNSYHNLLRRGNSGLFGTSKQDREMHGIGLGSIRSSVDALGGRMHVEGKDGVFQLFILISE